MKQTVSARERLAIRLVMWATVVVAVTSLGGLAIDVVILIDRSRSEEPLAGIVTISAVALFMSLVATGIAWTCKRWLDKVVVE